MKSEDWTFVHCTSAASSLTVLAKNHKVRDELTLFRELCQALKNVHFHLCGAAHADPSSVRVDVPLCPSLLPHGRLCLPSSLTRSAREFASCNVLARRSVGLWPGRLPHPSRAIYPSHAAVSCPEALFCPKALFLRAHETRNLPSASVALEWRVSEKHVICLHLVAVLRAPQVRIHVFIRANS